MMSFPKIAHSLRSHPAIPFILAALAFGCCVTPARTQDRLTPVGIDRIDKSDEKSIATHAVPASVVSPILDPVTNSCEPEVRSWAAETYAAGNWELQFLGGAYFKSSLGPLAPNFDYLPFSIRLGRIWTPPSWEGSRLLGNLETLLELTAAPITSGPGNIIVGPSLLLRRNFVWDPQQRCVPYLQAGAGIIYTDAGDDATQGSIGQEMEFLLQAQIGWRTRLNQNWTLDLEGGFQHISNAGIAHHNGGVNNFGFSIGLTRTLGRRY